MQQHILLQSKGLDFMPLLLILVVFFFFIIWPQMRKQKKAKQYYSELKKGDHVVTTGGIHGKIIALGETNFIIETEEGKLKIERAAISMDMTIAVYKNQNTAEKA